MGSLIGGAVEGITGKGAAKSAEGAANSSKKMTDLQRKLLEEQMPFLKGLGDNAIKLIGPILQDAMGAYDQSQKFDPATETQTALQAYDSAARDSLSTDIGTVNTGYTGRGFTSGNASSDQTGANEDVLARRASARGQYASSLKMNETNRRDEVTGRASDRVSRAFQLLDPSGRTTNAASSLQGAANSSLNQANYYGNQAAQAGQNAGAIVDFGANALKGIKWPWEKKKSPGAYQMT